LYESVKRVENFNLLKNLDAPLFLHQVYEQSKFHLLLLGCFENWVDQILADDGELFAGCSSFWER
jgi:hypothetical protein